MTVVDLGAVREAKREPDPKTVARAQELLRRVESGEVIGFGAFVKMSNGQLGHMTTGDMTTGDLMVAYRDWEFDELQRRSRG